MTRATRREHLHAEIRRLRHERDRARRERDDARRSLAVVQHQRNQAMENVRRLRDELAQRYAEEAR